MFGSGRHWDWTRWNTWNRTTFGKELYNSNVGSRRYFLFLDLCFVGETKNTHQKEIWDFLIANDIGNDGLQALAEGLFQNESLNKLVLRRTI